MDTITYRCTGKAMWHEGEFVGQSSCGADLTLVVEAVPPDGQDHEITCPSCGRISQVMRT